MPPSRMWPGADTFAAGVGVSRWGGCTGLRQAAAGLAGYHCSLGWSGGERTPCAKALGWTGLVRFKEQGARGCGQVPDSWRLEPVWEKLLGTWSRGGMDGSETLHPPAPGWPLPP